MYANKENLPTPKAIRELIGTKVTPKVTPKVELIIMKSFQVILDDEDDLILAISNTWGFCSPVKQHFYLTIAVTLGLDTFL
ncbi:hypothetical protein DSO57_1036441 [Entomophthora muscae]|uniref:Uncharacterized protein n=1 Tax=Entomophthora muscae TaxID=34485 RepID=A0ACC2SZA7_9FUNG|nr:hypothetical protein DSO57_1036441 [Entomophthora muscae]